MITQFFYVQEKKHELYKFLKIRISVFFIFSRDIIM